MKPVVMHVSIFQIDEAQDEVEAARKPLSSGKRSSSGVLYQAREKRNLLNDKLEFVVTAREQTVEGLDYVKQGTRKEPVKVLQEYADLRNKVERIKEERHELIQQKVSIDCDKLSVLLTVVTKCQSTH